MKNSSATLPDLPDDPLQVILSEHPNRASLKLTGNHGPVAPANLLGVNLEMASLISLGLLSDRIENPKFCGPAHKLTGLAEGWQPYGNNMGHVHNGLIPGMFLSGDECQMVHSYVSDWNGGLIQTGRYLRGGEELELEIWAKTRHHPVILQASLRPAASRAPEYCSVDILIDSAYWKCYRVRLTPPKDDSDAALFILFKTKGVVHFDQIHLRPADQPLISREVMEKIEELSLPTLRFPGGCISTNYHWRFGTGPAHLRPSLPDPVFKQRADYDFGTDEYLAMCHEHGTRPFLTVNIGTGTPEDAGAWARYCAEWHATRGLPLPEIYFQAGNEQYGAWETSHMNAEMYLAALKAFVPEIRFNYPRAIVIGLGEPLCAGVAGSPDSHLRELLLREGKGLLDVITINRYKGQWYDDPEGQMLNVPESVEKIRLDLVQLIEDCRSAGYPAKVALSEWGYWLQASHWDGNGFYEPDDALHGLFVSGMLHMLARLSPEVELCAYYHLINAMGMIRNDGGKVSSTSIAEIFRLYRPALPGEVLPIEADSALLQGVIPQVDMLALRQGDALWVFASNRSLTEATTLNAQELTPRTTEARMFAAENHQSPLVETHPLPIDGTWELPPLSLLRLCCKGFFQSTTEDE